MRCRRRRCDRGSVDRGRPLLCGIRRRALWFGRRGIALISRFVFAVEQSDPNWRTTANIWEVPTPPLRSSRRERLGRRDERIQASRRLQGPRGRRARCVQTPHRTRIATHPRLFDGISATPERSFSSATPHPPWNERNADVDPPPFPTSRMTRQASRYAATMRSPRVRAIRPSGYGARPSAASGSRAAPSAPGTNPSSPRSRTPQPPTPSSPAGATRSSSRGTPPPATPRPRW